MRAVYVASNEHFIDSSHAAMTEGLRLLTKANRQAKYQK